MCIVVPSDRLRFESTYRNFTMFGGAGKNDMPCMLGRRGTRNYNPEFRPLGRD